MSTVAFCWRPSSLRIGADTSGAASAAVATWYSSGWNR